MYCMELKYRPGDVVLYRDRRNWLMRIDDVEVKTCTGDEIPHVYCHGVLAEVEGGSNPTIVGSTTIINVPAKELSRIDKYEGLVKLATKEDTFAPYKTFRNVLTGN